MRDHDQNKNALWTSSFLKAGNDRTKVCDLWTALRLELSQHAYLLNLLHQEIPPHWDRKSRRLDPHACDQVFGQISAVGKWKTQTARLAQWHDVLQPIPSNSHLLARSSVSTSAPHRRLKAKCLNALAIGRYTLWSYQSGPSKRRTTTGCRHILRSGIRWL